MEEELLTVGDVARDCEVCEPTVREWERSGKLPAMRTRSGVRLFTRANVERWKARRANPKKAKAVRQ